MRNKNKIIIFKKNDRVPRRTRERLLFFKSKTYLYKYYIGIIEYNISYGYTVDRDGRKPHRYRYRLCIENSFLLPYIIYYMGDFDWKFIKPQTRIKHIHTHIKKDDKTFIWCRRQRCAYKCIILIIYSL